MIELITQYSAAEIITFFVVTALSIKGAVMFWDWSYNRLRQVFAKENDEANAKDLTQKQINKNREGFQLLREEQLKVQEEIKGILAKIDLLIESDKDDIKAFITEKHHYFCYKQKWIDNYSMDCLEKRYKHYKDEGGNSFIHELMEDLRGLDRIPPEQVSK